MNVSIKAALPVQNELRFPSKEPYTSARLNIKFYSSTSTKIQLIELKVHTNWTVLFKGCMGSDKRQERLLIAFHDDYLTSVTFIADAVHLKP